MELTSIFWSFEYAGKTVFSMTKSIWYLTDNYCIYMNQGYSRLIIKDVEQK